MRSVLDEWGKTAIEKIMTSAPHTIESNRSVGAVLSLMREYGISHVPIMESGKLVGMITIQDILEEYLLATKTSDKGRYCWRKN